jgi:uncharacterized protein (DUF1810 family)
MPPDLDRFVVAQQGAYPGALEELLLGHKTGHWMWFIFPQVAGLGSSSMSQQFAVRSLDEARDYIAHPILGPRLRECAGAMLQIHGRTAVQILGSIDALKLHSSMTLFHRAAPDVPAFVQVLDRYFDGVADEKTDTLLA